MPRAVIPCSAIGAVAIAPRNSRRFIPASYCNGVRIAVMRILGLFIALSMVAACSGSTRPASTKGAVRASASGEIAAAPDQPINALEKSNKAQPGDLDAVVGRGYVRILVAPSRAHLETV